MITFADRKGGFPHSEIFGSKGARASPKRIAACHVLHRLSTPRHPSEALMRLIVLSKTHARRIVRTRPSPSPNRHTRAFICQIMMSSLGHPSKRARARRENPSIHNVIRLFSSSPKSIDPPPIQSDWGDLAISSALRRDRKSVG